jgi:hypothetical protein
MSQMRNERALPAGLANGPPATHAALPGRRRGEEKLCGSPRPRDKAPSSLRSHALKMKIDLTLKYNHEIELRSTTPTLFDRVLLAAASITSRRRPLALFASPLKVV